MEHASIVKQPPKKSILLDDRTIEEALAVCYRAVAACQFYPRRHPTLLDALEDGYQAWRRVEDDHRWEHPGLQLRNGKLWLGDSPVGAGNPAIGSLARVFAAHGLVGLRKRGPLSRDAFSQLAFFLATSAEVIASRGGITSLWKRSPYGEALQLITLNIQPGGGASGTSLSAPRRQQNTEWGAGLPEDEEGLADAEALLSSRLQAMQKKSPRERAVVDLLLRLGRTDEMPAFLRLLEEIARFVEDSLAMQRHRESFYIVLFLYREAQNMDALGREDQRDYLLDTIRLLVRGEFLSWLIQSVTSAQGDREAEAGEFILRSLGKEAVVAVINALCVESRRIGRRRLVNVLVGIGNPAVPWAIRMLDDQRWFVVRNMVTVLGGVGSEEAMKALLRLGGDPDARIRKEVAQALGRSPSPGAEKQLLELLDDRDPGVRQTAIGSCSAHRSEAVLSALWKTYDRTSIGRAEWEVKISVLQAVARLSMPEATGRLKAILRKRHLFRRDRWLRVNCAAVHALGCLGSDEALDLLQDLKACGEPDLRTAAARALGQLQTRLAGAP